MTIVLTAVATLVVTILAGVVLDYLRRRGPKIVYVVRDAVPIALEGKYVGAYLVQLANVSRSVVKDVTCHIQAPPARLRNGGISTDHGLEYEVKETEDSLQIAIPYLKGGDELTATVIAEAPYYVPPRPQVAIRSPQELTVVLGEQKLQQKWLRPAYLTAALFASVASGVVMALGPGGVVTSQRDVLTFAASVSGLPRLADLYATSSHVSYYNLGDVAFAWAAASSDRAEIERYRKLLNTVVQSQVWMLDSSRANLYYCLGKIDLLLGDNEQAIRDFRESQVRSKATVEEKIKVDEHVRNFLINHAVR